MTEQRTSDLKLSDRQLLRIVLAAQRDLAKVLFLMNINSNAREAAGTLHRDLEQVLKGIPK